ncbi:hypothetical protein AO382_0846 [Moraxella catarrhalis]|uniref:Uncharacterized protein n=1 Tax=Moraxella catarrhalis TaxID=480 RepID=A0A7Z1A4A1_MORCA|nr:hypothetical protein AO382_0846 [Moraxella catarrhalis]
MVVLYVKHKSACTAFDPKALVEVATNPAEIKAESIIFLNIFSSILEILHIYQQ